MFRPLQCLHQGGIYKDIQVQHVNDVVEVEVCRRDISDKLLFIIDFAICWINQCIARNMDYVKRAHKVHGHFVW